jgi:hypothetical protein
MTIAESVGAEPPERPQKTSVATIGLSDLQSVEARAVVAVWKKRRGFHSMPLHEADVLHDLGAFAAHVSLAAVVNDGEDYLFRFIGDAHIRAYGSDFAGKSTSDVTAISPRFGKQLKASYDLVRITGQPFVLRGAIGWDFPQSRFLWFETAYLPFGVKGAVTQILNVAVYSLCE